MSGMEVVLRIFSVFHREDGWRRFYEEKADGTLSGDRARERNNEQTRKIMLLKWSR
jgi:hypothetical protein